MRKTTLLILFSLIGVLACIKQEDRVLARVGEETVLVKEFLETYRPSVYPTEKAELEAKRKVLEPLIDYKLMVVEAKRRGYDKDPALSDSVKIAYESALIEALYRKEVVEKVKASRLDARKFYNVDKVLLHLYIIHTDSDTAAALVLSYFSSGVPFETLAVRYSTGPFVTKGGDLGKRPLSFFFEEDAFDKLSRLKVGQVTPPLKSRLGGYDIYYLMERQERDSVPSFEEQEATIRRRIELKRERELQNKSLEKLLKEVTIEYNNEGLNLLTKPKKDLTQEDLGTWTVKINGEVVESVGSMLDVYDRMRLGDSLGVSSKDTQGVGRSYAIRPALVRIAEKRHLGSQKSVQDAVDRFVARYIYNRLYRKEVLDRVQVTPEEVEAYYEEHPEEFTVPESREISIIRSSSESDINQAYSILRQGVPFSDVAARFSDHEESAQEGGSIGSRTLNDALFKPFVQKAFTIPKGIFSEPFQVYNGFGIVMVTGIRESYTRPFDEVSAYIERRLRNERERQQRDEFIEELRSKTPVEINEDLLLKLAKVKAKPVESDSSKKRAEKR